MAGVEDRAEAAAPAGDSALPFLRPFFEEEEEDEEEGGGASSAKVWLSGLLRWKADGDGERVRRS